MAKPKFNLTASPTFKEPVAIPCPGGKSVNVEFTFKHRTKEEFKEFIDALPNREDVDVIMDMASGWELDEPFEAMHGLYDQNDDKYKGVTLFAVAPESAAA